MALVDDYVRENERIRHEIEEELALVRGGGEGHDLLQLENILTELNVIYSIPGQPLTYLEAIVRRWGPEDALGREIDGLLTLYRQIKYD
ncbi:MAG: hypothetical protein ACOX74_00850 [Lachnospiraceae bacterium]|jgi:hypothetical protein